MQEKNFFQRNMVWIIPVGIVLILVMWIWGQYNTLVTMSEGVDSKWSQVENVLQRRYDLIPNLTNTVKGMTKQELDVTKMVTDARTRYGGAVTTNEKAKLAGEVEGAIGRLLMIAESYPTLQSSQNFKDLMVSLEGAENRISVERLNYNESVRAFNVQVKRFPASLAASLFGFGPKEYFDVPEEAQVNPEVKF